MILESSKVFAPLVIFRISRFVCMALVSFCSLQVTDASFLIFQKHIRWTNQNSGRISTSALALATKSPRTNARERRPMTNKHDIDKLVAEIGLSPAKPRKKNPDQPLRKPSPSNLEVQSSCSSLLRTQEVSLQTQLDYARNGHVVLRSLLDPTALKTLRKDLLEYAAAEELKAWRQKVQVASDSAEVAASCRTVNECQQKLESLGITASLPFLQYFNTWRSLSEVKNLAFSLGETAAILLDVPTVRLYQDSVFWKRINDGPTPWHADARMGPFDTSHFITFWIPLDPVPADGTGLIFCSKSHSDFALPYWNPIDEHDQDHSEWNRLPNRYPKKLIHYMPLSVGDVTAHSGWTLHCANENSGDMDRVALAISFVDARAELRPDALEMFGKGDNEDRWSYQGWAKEVKPRRKFRHELVPIVWPQSDP